MRNVLLECSREIVAINLLGVTVQRATGIQNLREISVSHDGKYEDDSFLGNSTMRSH
jgi:hypothetical protein